MRNFDELLNKVDLWKDEMKREKNQLKKINREKKKREWNKFREDIKEYQEVMKKVDLELFAYKTPFEDNDGRAIYFCLKQDGYAYSKHGVYQEYIGVKSSPSMQGTIEWWKTVDKDHFYKEFEEDVEAAYRRRINVIRLDIDEALKAV